MYIVHRVEHTILLNDQKIFRQEKKGGRGGGRGRGGGNTVYFGLCFKYLDDFRRRKKNPTFLSKLFL